MQIRHNGQADMIRVVQCHHGGYFLRLTWNPGIILSFNLDQSDDCWIVLSLLEGT
jgi:hypothetical protein